MLVTGPITFQLITSIVHQGVIGGDICASSNGKTLMHRQIETVQPWESRRLRLMLKVRYGSGTKVGPTPKETRSIRGTHKWH